MSDIGPIHGLGALIIFLPLLLLNTVFLILSIIFLLFEKNRNKRVLPFLNAKGLFISTLIVELMLVFLILFIEFSNDHEILAFVDLVSPVFAFTTLLALVIVNIRYSRQNKKRSNE